MAKALDDGGTVNPVPLRVWTDGDGVTWACDAYDHGPFCRRCEPVDGVEIVREAQRRLREMWEGQCRS